MRKENQIEEMAKIFCGMKNGCDGCMWDKAHCNERNYAEECYNAGYRKQSVGEWKFHKDGSGTCSECHVTQRNVWDYDNWQNFCGRCGAKMKGGAE